MNFLRSTFASLLGSLAAFGLIIAFFFMTLAGVSAVLSTDGDKVRSISDNSILNLELNLPIVERTPTLEKFWSLLDVEPKVLGLNTIINGIQKAASDERIKGISLHSDFISAGWAQVRGIREALKQFKKTGKFVYAYADFFTQKGYYLASVADKILVNPMGNIDFKGLSSEVLYYKDFEDKYGVKVEVVRHGKYKSAVEPYLQNHMSNENRKQISSLLRSIWDTLRDEIAEERGIAPNIVDYIASDLLADTSEKALAQQLIDSLAYESDYVNLLKEAVAIPKSEKLHLVHPGDLSFEYNQEVKDRIALIYAQGPIIYGEGNENMIAPGKFVKAIEDATKDSWVKAIVLRIDSPGGSALASEILWKAIEEAQEEKPVVVSMGNVAASGGYYIAAGAEKIFADPLTITGSIGVFAALPNATGLADNLGVNAEQVVTHKNAMGYSVFEPLQLGFERSTTESIEKIYNTFKRRVSVGRILPLEVVERIAQGRVWSGKSALENGLIDDLGGLDEALNAAAELVGIESFNIIDYPKIEPNFENMLNEAIPFMKTASPIEQYTPDFVKELIQNTSKIDLNSQIQTRMPFEINIR